MWYNPHSILFGIQTQILCMKSELLNRNTNAGVIYYEYDYVLFNDGGACTETEFVYFCIGLFFRKETNF